ncbi:MAG: hypothetical protein JNK29_03590, partial [Anaerolineales bacterium]|nr:hypothetical protein [Anaerolineales bacterium]
MRTGQLIGRLMVGVALVAAALPAAAQSGQILYLPQVAREYNAGLGQRVVNARYLPGLVGAGGNLDRVSEMAIFWFGRVTASENYTDVRVGYTDTELVVYLAVFDRLLWYDTAHVTANLEAWDGATLYLGLDAAGSNAPAASTYKLVAQLSDWQGRTNYQAAFRGNGASWGSVTLAGFVTDAGCAWEDNNVGGYNNGENNRGCGITFRVPFTALGLAGRPADGALWRLGVANHDRESQAGPPLADKVWPPELSANVPATWGRLRFGQPAFTPPPASNPQTVTIRHG